MPSTLNTDETSSPSNDVSSINEKPGVVVVKNNTASSNEPNELNRHDSNSQLDDAWKFLNTIGNVEGANVAAVNLAGLRRKIDCRILPAMFCCYTLQFLDKVILNYAAVMGLQKDLHFDAQGNQFSAVATYLFVGLLCFEIPNIYLVKVFPAAKWLGLNVFLWGIATACGAAAYNYQTLLISRIFLGIFEATIGPSLILIVGQWYTSAEQAPRLCFWYLGLGFGQIIGGALSYGFQHISSDASVSGWRSMFILLGCITVVVGLYTTFFLPDTPMQAKWLSDAEKCALLQHISVNQTGIANRKFRPVEVLDALLDPQVWLTLFSVILLSVSSGVITTYSATLIRNLGYSPKQAALMNMPSGVVSIFFTLVAGIGIRKKSHRWAWILVCLAPSILGGVLMSFLSPSGQGHNGILAGIYLVNACVAPLAIFYSWILSNVAGTTKRAFVCAIVAGSFSIGNIIGPQTFQAHDAPQYRPAKIALLATQAGCAFVTVLLACYYAWINRKRHAIAPLEVDTQETTYQNAKIWSIKTDRENSKFIYSF